VKAVVQERYGPPLEVMKVTDVGEPTPGPREVIVAVKAASVNAGDTAVVKGMPYLIRAAYGLTKPRSGIRGSDIAGVVATVGSEVVGMTPGDEVFGKGEGAFAEMVRAKPGNLAAKPASVTFEQAATLPVAGLTALQGLRDAGRVEPGQRVLINGGSGGVGTFAIQVAKALGAEVTAVSSTRNLDTAGALGADHVVDYTRGDFTADNEPFDVVFDNAASRSLADTRRLLIRGGTLVLNNGNLDSRWLASLPRMAAALLSGPVVSQHLRTNVQKWSQEDLAQLANLVVEGKVTPVIERTHPLEDTADAVDHVGLGHAQGKVVIVTD
jgi:NADPH:quinone reductase-like Zn-dependent oxidoreductase